MRKNVFALFALLFVWFIFPVSAQQQLTAFPGAEGYGKFTTGGRGGNVYYVTRLDDCTDNDLVEGTLRWAVRTGDDTPRTILFKVCGTIYLTSPLKLQHPNVTIAGQTAPGGGICIAGYKFYVCKPNVIIRHIRFRAGDIPSSSGPSLDMENTRNVIIDHCSITWSMEECLTAYDTDSTTVQWCIIGEGLYKSKNGKGARAYATQWGGEHSTMHHCLITNCHNRTPRFNGVRDEANIAKGHHDHDAYVSSEFANNVIFNWGKANSLYGGENDTTKNHDAFNQPVGYCHVYLRNNYFRAGPTTLACALSKRYFVQGSKVGDYGRWYLDGNKFETGNKFNYTNAVWQDAALAQVNDSNLFGYVDNNSTRAFNLDGVTTADQAHFDRYVLTEPYATSLDSLETADEAYTSVCQLAGAQLPRLDEVDTRLLQEAAGIIDPQFAGPTVPQWLGIIDSQENLTFSRNDTLVTSYPYIGLLEGDSIPADTDLDGMPDYWETAHSLNPNDPADANLTTLSQLAQGYTNLEFYLNDGDGELADPIPAERPVPAITPDGLREQTSPKAEDNGRKRLDLQEGVLYIESNSRTYNVAGQQTK